MSFIILLLEYCQNNPKILSIYYNDIFLIIFYYISLMGYVNYLNELYNAYKITCETRKISYIQNFISNVNAVKSLFHHPKFNIYA